MLKKAAATGLAGLGLIGGAGTVVYHDNGDATVTITNSKGEVQSVTLDAGGQSFSCPNGTTDKVKPHDIKLARIELTLRQVRRAEEKIQRQYPGNEAPAAVIDRYNALGRRDNRLVDAFNAEVDARNAIIDRDCTADADH
jgi:hypothetical protein